MAYLKNRTHRAAKKGGLLARLGLGDAASCGAADQLWYPNLTFNGITGQCSTPAAAQAALASGAATGNLSQGTAGTYTQPSGPSVTDAIGKFFGSLLSGATAAPKPAMVVQQHGMSTTTKVALAGGAVLLVALIARR